MLKKRDKKDHSKKSEQLSKAQEGSVSFMGQGAEKNQAVKRDELQKKLK